MKYCRFQEKAEARYGLVESVAGKDQITRMLSIAPHLGEGDLEDRPTKRMDQIAFSEARLLAPVQPSKIVCIGRNYRAHAAEFGNDVPTEPLIFLKALSSLLSPGETVLRPGISERVDHEAELGIVIGRKCHRLKPDEDVRPYILGYTCVNDVTARDLQMKDGQWSRAKGFDTFCPVGPLVATELDPWKGVGIEAKVNGSVRQHGNTNDLIFAVDILIRHISQVMTLFPGDLIATGTPDGVGPVVAGDVMEVTVEGIGTLSNPVADEPA
jgi:2-keto-4-pentenoate hydratase/2-oxohepta-3-ene-1,7-dioic acid hydratase in catechol pathway